MKKLLIASCLLPILLMSVKCDDEFPKEPTLPPATRTGEDTFGCLINGEVFTDFALPFTPAAQAIEIRSLALTSIFYFFA